MRRPCIDDIYVLYMSLLQVGLGDLTRNLTSDQSTRGSAANCLPFGQQFIRTVFIDDDTRPHRSRATRHDTTVIS